MGHHLAIEPVDPTFNMVLETETLVRSSPGDVHQRFKPFQLAVHRILWCHGGGWEDWLVNSLESFGKFMENIYVIDM